MTLESLGIQLNIFLPFRTVIITITVTVTVIVTVTVNRHRHHHRQSATTSSSPSTVTINRHRHCYHRHYHHHPTTVIIPWRKSNWRLKQYNINPEMKRFYNLDVHIRCYKMDNMVMFSSNWFTGHKQKETILALKRCCVSTSNINIITTDLRSSASKRDRRNPANRIHNSLLRCCTSTSDIVRISGHNFRHCWS